MIVEVLIRESDPSGNEEYHHYGFFNAQSLEQVDQMFQSDRAFVKFCFQEVQIQDLPDTVQDVIKCRSQLNSRRT
jgi:hypothetical protein